MTTTKILIINIGKLLGCFLLFALLFQPTPALAQQGCGGGTKADAAGDYRVASAVFIGKVASIAEQQGATAAASFNNVTFDVTGSWKRALTGQVVVRTSLDDCKVPFAVGETWVVYAYEIEGQLYAFASGNSAVFSQDAPGVVYIRDLRPSAGLAVLEDFGTINIIGYVVGAYVIFFLLGGAIYYIWNRARTRRRQQAK